MCGEIRMCGRTLKNAPDGNNRTHWTVHVRRLCSSGYVINRKYILTEGSSGSRPSLLRKFSDFGICTKSRAYTEELSFELWPKEQELVLA